ncbi:MULTISPECIES: hypothetical protein [Bradyrhizobium]|uniref:hypothetical protein n=1 Tax=Bradyrhizobium TaxID=374 RepID=UPI000AFA059D|nr:hypothetical protein [Bradyrhizobium retamae]
MIRNRVYLTLAWDGQFPQVLALGRRVKRAGLGQWPDLPYSPHAAAADDPALQD